MVFITHRFRCIEDIPVKLSPILLCYNLSCILYLQHVDPVELMEPALRVQVMVAQSHASMWRRNGFALLNQVGHVYGILVVFFIKLCHV